LTSSATALVSSRLFLVDLRFQVGFPFFFGVQLEVRSNLLFCVSLPHPIELFSLLRRQGFSGVAQLGPLFLHFFPGEVAVVTPQLSLQLLEFVELPVLVDVPGKHGDGEWEQQ
jgi:hypothetical protein